MMVKKTDEDSRALVLNETVDENYSPTSMVSINQHGLEVARRCYSGEEVEKALYNTRGVAG
jgi:hypothetical protein